MTQEEILSQYNLPNLKELHQEFGDFDTEDSDIIHLIIEKLVAKTQEYTKFLEDLLHPDSNLVSMQEASMFSNEEREEIFSLFKECIALQRKIIVLQIDNNRQELVSYFKEFYSFWLSKKQQLKTIVAKAIAVWSNIDEKEMITTGYFG